MAANIVLEDLEFWDDECLALALPELCKIAENHSYPVKPTEEIVPCESGVDVKTTKEKEDEVMDSDFTDVTIPRSNMYIGETFFVKAEKEKRRIAIRPGRLKYLQTLERNLPKIILYAVKAYLKGRLTKLHTRDKSNRDGANARARRYLDKHRKSVNARRRAKRGKNTSETVADTSQKAPEAKEIIKIAENKFVIHNEKLVKF